MKNIHVLSTPNPSRLLKQNNNKLILSKQIVYSHISKHLENINQNICITNDEEIKEGEYCLTKTNEVIKFKKSYTQGFLYKKIILTTDQHLINDGIQPINDEFLEWFVKNSSCEEVKTNKIFEEHGSFDISYYKIIIPKEEILPQQIWNEEKMEGIKKLIQKQKLIEIIKSDEDAKIFVEALENIPEPNDKLKKAFRDFGKQETLEEAAVRLYSDRLYPMYGSIRRDAFTNGAKWQQEQHNFLPGLIKQFDPKEGEINGEQWTAVHFLKWLELNKFKIVK